MNSVSRVFILISLLFAHSLWAEDLYFDLLNDSTASVVEFHTSVVKESDWGENLIEGYELPANGKVNVAIEDGADVCEYDILVTFDDGSTVDDRNVNLCELGSYTVTD